MTPEELKTLNNMLRTNSLADLNLALAILRNQNVKISDDIMYSIVNFTQPFLEGFNRGAPYDQAIYNQVVKDIEFLDRIARKKFKQSSMPFRTLINIHEIGLNYDKGKESGKVRTKVHERR
jgi:hypothetical protein